MAPAVWPMSCATPEFFSAPWVPAGQFTVSPESSFQVLGAADFRYLVKLFVVPDPSERCTTTIGVDGRVASGLSALIAASSHLVISVEKILANVSGDSWSFSTPSRL